MAWDVEIPMLLRSYIGDISTSPTYSEDDLKGFVLTAGFLVDFDVTLKTQYDIDIIGQTFTPDPTDRIDQGIRDKDYIALIVARAGAIIYNNEVRLYGAQYGSIKDYTMVIDTKRDLKTLQALAKSFDDKYSGLRQAFVRGDGNLGKAIISSDWKNPYYYGPLSTNFSDFLRSWNNSDNFGWDF